jgi:autotransporter translocation and assembly factor TamB
LKALKYLLLFILLLIGALFVVLSSRSALDFVAKKALAASGLNIGYERLEGDIFHGLALVGTHYEDKAGANLYLKADFPALREGILHVEDIRIEEAWVKEPFLKSLIENNEMTQQEKSSNEPLPIKMLIVAHLHLSANDISYEEYTLSRFDLRANDIRYDMKKRIDGAFKLAAASSVADINATIDLKESRYDVKARLKAKRTYLARYIKEQNITLGSDPELDVALNGDLHTARFDLQAKPLHLEKSPLHAALQRLKLAGSYDIDRSYLDSSGDLKLNSDAADANLTFWTDMYTNEVEDTLRYRASLKGVLPKPTLAKIFGDQNISFEKESLLHLKASGNMKSVDANMTLKGGIFHYAAYRIAPDHLDLFAKYNLKNSHLAAKGESDIRSNAADFNLTFDTALLLDDPQHSLKLSLKSDLVPHKPFVEEMLKEQNISIAQLPILHLRADTVGSRVHATLKSDRAKLRVEQIEAVLNDLESSVVFDTGTQQLDADYVTRIASDLADLQVEGNTSMRLDDINRTLRYSAHSKVQAKDTYLKKRFPKERVDIRKLSALVLDITGDASVAKANLNLNGVATIGGERIEPTIKDTKVRYDLRKKRVSAQIDAALRSPIADAKTKANVDVALEDINNSLRYEGALFLRQKKGFASVNLSQLGDINLDFNGSLKKVKADLNAKKLNASIKSGDFDRFTFKLDTKTLYLDKIYTALPPEMKKSSAALEAEGYYQLKEKQGDIALRLKKLKMMHREIATNRFRIAVDGENFILTPMELRAKGFLLKLDAERRDGRLRAHVKNSAFNGFIDFSQEPLHARGELDIPSIEKMIAQLDKVYPMEGIPKIKGSLLAKVDTASDGRIKAEVTSPKIVLKAGRLQKLDIVAYYKPERIDIARFRFDMSGFKPKAMNKKVRLAHPGFVIMRKDGMQVDFVLENLLSFKAEQKGDLLVGKLTTNRLFLAYPEYGQTKITTNIDLYKSGEQTAISGDIALEETEITYESRMLDISQDPDIIIVTKKKRKRQVDDDFTKNLFLDLHIYSKDEVVYKVEAGTIVMKPDIEIRKDFGTKPRLLGKVNILEGEYDWGDKRFKLLEGAIAFRGLEEINPHLDLHVEYEIEDVLIYIDILGDKRKPKLLFKSKPMMSKKDIFSYLLFGFAVSESDGAQSSAANAAEKIFGRALAKDLARELKLDRLDLNRNELGGIDIKAGKKVNKKTIIYYQNRVENRLQQSSVIIERKLGKHFELDTQIGQESQAIDLIYKKGFK